METLRLRELQLHKFNRLLNEVWERNPFYTHKWCRAGVPHHRIAALDQLADFPFTTRQELLDDQRCTPPLGTNLSQRWQEYKRIHRSSGTSSAPLYWADTSQTWRWVIQCSQSLFLLAGIAPHDRIFSTLPLTNASGPWIIYEAACQLGNSCFNGGNTDFTAQLTQIRQFSPAVLIISPGDLHKLADTALENGINPSKLSIRRIISFGKDGCKFEALRQYARDVWRAECFNRYGMTEAGSIAGECNAHSGMHLLESEHIAEVIDPETCLPVEDGQLGELVLTNLGRLSRPIVRYRTGDLARMSRNIRCNCGRTDALLLGDITRLSK